MNKETHNSNSFFAEIFTINFYGSASEQQLLDKMLTQADLYGDEIRQMAENIKKNVKIH